MVSIIIPALNESAFIGQTLKSTMALKGDFEIIVVDGGSSDSTSDIVKSFKQVRFATSKKGRSHQMNAGAELAKGEILLFLHADTILPAEAISAVNTVLSQYEYVAGSFYLKFNKRHWLLSFFSFMSKMNSSLFTYGDQAFFVRKSCFTKIGGFKPIAFMEDVEILHRLKKEGKFKKLSLPVTTSARRFNKTGVIFQFISDVVLVGLYRMGAAPCKLKKYYKDHSAF